jgi:cytochrome c peroxidase
MSKKHLGFISLFFLLLTMGFVLIDLPEFKVPIGWPKPVYDFKKNTFSNEKIMLGRVLFYDPILSKDNTISCASCHSPYNAFAHTDHALSHGIGDSIGFRNAPALFNLAWQKSFMWDGAINNLDEQAVFPITHPKEMGEKLNNVIQKINQSEKYKKLITDAYGIDIINKQQLLQSISRFILSLVSANSKYDSVMQHKLSFTTQELNGYKLFKKNCSTCHTEPLFTNGSFKNNGVKPSVSINDYGRMRITQNKKDSLLFKVPTLRNLSYTYPYMHDGRFTKLSEVLQHYTSGIDLNSNVSKGLKQPIVFTPNEKVDLIAFLLTLNDRSFVFNPNYSFIK